MKASAVFVCTIAMSVACSENTRRTPLGPTNTPGPIPPAITYTVSGVVRATGSVPLAGVRIAVLGQERAAFAVSDGSGAYSFSGVTAVIDNISPLLSASASGYFTDVEFANRTYGALTKDTQIDFTLTPWVPIALGQVIEGKSPLGGPECSHWGYGTSACQRFALTVAASGTLEVTLSAPEFAFDLDIVGPDGTFALYNAFWVSPQRVSIPVDAGFTYEIRVIGGWNPPREFELTTAMR